MKRALIPGVLAILTSFLAPAVFASPYIEEPGKWVYITGEQLPPVYPSLEDARKKSNPAKVFDDASRVGEVLEQREGFLFLAEQPTDDMDFEARRKGWIPASSAVDLEKWLLNPGPELIEEVMSCQEELPHSYTVDLDKTHKNAMLTVTAYPTLTGGAAVMEVRDKPGPTGRVLWSSPKISMILFPTDPASPFCAANSAFWPSVVGDVDGDKIAEIILELPPTEAVPPLFTMLGWTGNEFALRHEGVLLISDTPTPKTLPLLPGDTEVDFSKPVVWLNTFRNILPDGSLDVILVRSKVKNGELDDWESFAARVRLGKTSATIEKVDWNKPLTGDEEQE